MPPQSNCRTASTSGTSPQNNAHPLLAFCGERDNTAPNSDMPEAASQVVAQMPRGKRVGLLLLFLGPAVAIYTLFSIYPLIATMALSTYTSNPSGAQHFVGLANFEVLLGDSLWSKPFWNAFGNNLIFFAVHMCVQNPIGIALAGLLRSEEHTSELQSLV